MSGEDLAERRSEAGGDRVGGRDESVSGPRSVEVRNFTWPGGVQLLAPSIGEPTWRTVEGRPQSFASAVAGQNEEFARELVAMHADSIAALVRAAGAAKAVRDDAEMRRCAAAASRLCGEVAGLWPEHTREH